MKLGPSTLVCAGCGRVPGEEPLPFRCANAGVGDVDHVIVHRLDTSQIRFPEGPEDNPFVRFRVLSRSYYLATHYGMSDDDYVALVRALDDRVAQVDGRGFRLTPMEPSSALAERVGLLGSEGGKLWVKDETKNVAGSHKARHLMGLSIYLSVVEALGLVKREGAGKTLAIASCGNAALAAAVVARASDRPLRVFIPTWADEKVVARLSALGAELVRCERTADSPPGDPCYHAFRAAVAGGALPFTCQGSENGLTIDGGKTLGWEIATRLQTAGEDVDRVVIQVGGGALATALIQGLEDACALGAIAKVPHFYPTQSAGGHPFERAYSRVAERAKTIGVEAALEHAAAHRSEYMWPLEHEAKSVATGILDDETYDWLAIVRGMLASGGSPVVVDDETIIEARDAARETLQIDVDATGASGLAGLFELHAQGQCGAADRTIAVLTGVTR